jgi:hypothetical protein
VRDVQGQGVVRGAEEAGPYTPAWISCPECSPEPDGPDWPDDEGEAGDGDDWPEDAVVGLAPDHEVRLTLSDVIALEVDRSRSWGNALGDLLAAHGGGLLAEVERTGARDGAALLDRWADRAVNPVG